MADAQDLNLAGFYSLGADINKAKGRDQTPDTTEGAVSEYLPELSLGMKNEDLIKLTTKWEKSWNDSTVRGNWVKQRDDNENYWKGKQYNKIEVSTGDNSRPLVDNQIFQSVETYLPAATRQNPEPLVALRATEDKKEEYQKFTEIVRDRLADWSDDVKLRLKIKKAGRNWLLSLVGVGKMGWDVTNNRPALKIIRPHKLILDPDGVNDEDGYSGKFVGEYRKMEAGALIKIATEQGEGKEAVDKIKAVCKDELGTDVQFVEWWTNEYLCWTLDQTVILKKKNPHWNYPPELAKPTTVVSADAPESPKMGAEPVTSPEAGDMPKAVDETSDSPAVKATPIDSSTPGMPTVPTIANETATPATAIDTTPVPTANVNNHFPTPRMPYIWISIFNLGKTPVDETSLVTQNLAQQDLINKRLKQIDKNADGMNGGVVVSEERSGLTKDEAKGVTDALRRGGTVIIPAGSPTDAIVRMPSVPLPADVYNQLVDTRNRMYDLFGIRGITPAGIKNEDTVRGKIITKGLDTDRIGGGITEYFEQFADEIYNWVYQLYLVYDDIFQNNPDAKLPKIKITVKEGSLLPKDATTKANQAIELANAGKMALIDMYKALEFANPEEMAANVWLEMNAPELLFKDNPLVQQVVAAKKQAAMAAAQANAGAAGGGKKGPNESINFKDLPPEGKAQMAKQAGIDLHPAAVAAHDIEQRTPIALPEKPQG